MHLICIVGLYWDCIFIRTMVKSNLKIIWYLSQFLVPDQSGTVWGHLGPPEADLTLIPDFNTDPVFPPCLPVFSPTVHD